MKLTRSQEEFLIQIGLNALVAGATGPQTVSQKNGERRWTPEQRRKFRRTLARKKAAK